MSGPVPSQEGLDSAGVLGLWTQGGRYRIHCECNLFLTEMSSHCKVYYMFKKKTGKKYSFIFKIYINDGHLVDQN